MPTRTIIQGRAQILLGDTTSHGGVVISGSPSTSVEGRPVARVGDLVTCPICKPHVFPIVEGDITFADNYMAIALHGHKTACGAELIAVAHTPGSPVAPSPESPPGPYSDLLGADIEEMMAHSPTLTEDLKIMEKEKWKITFGEAGKGSVISRKPPSITLDPDLKKNPRSLMQILAHEVGHARYPFEPDMSSRAAYVRGALDDEGAAVLRSIKIQREILKSGGIDIGVPGQAKNIPLYNKAYDHYLKDGDYNAAIRKIGNVMGPNEYTSNTLEPYADYYGNSYDKRIKGPK